MNYDPVQVSFQAYLLDARTPAVLGRTLPIPFRYRVTLYVDDIPTYIEARAWGKRKAMEIMQHMVEHGNDLINQYGVVHAIAAEIYARRKEEAMAKLKVGDTVRLLVDIGQFKKGRVCRVVEVAEPSFYEARGANGWMEDKYPIKVLPVSMSGDRIALTVKEAIALARGEFGPVDQEVE